MHHYSLNITEMPVYLDGSFYLYKIEQANKTYPYEHIKLLFDDGFGYSELSISDSVLYENDKMERKISKKIRIPQDRLINSMNVLRIDNNYYRVYNIYHFTNKDGIKQSDITLEDYPNPIVEE